MPNETTPNTPAPTNLPTGLDESIDAGFHTLGHKAFYLLTIKRSLPALCFFILDVILFVVRYSNTLTDISRATSTSIYQLASLLNSGILIVTIIFLLALILGLLAGYISYIAFKYKMAENGFALERGILSKQETSIPFRQIQNVDVEQSLLDRLFGVCDLIILTAGHEDSQYASQNQSEIVLPAIDVNIARDLQKNLLNRANIQEVAPTSI